MQLQSIVNCPIIASLQSAVNAAFFRASDAKTIELASGTLFRIRTFEKNGCINIAGGSQDDSARAITFPCQRKAADNELFKMDAEGRLVAKHSGKCLDIAGGGKTDTTPVDQWTCSGNEWMVFNLMSDGSIRPNHTVDMCLQAPTFIGGGITINECNFNNKQQKWMLGLN